MFIFISVILALALLLSLIGIASPFVAVVIGSVIIGILASWITLGALVCLSKGDVSLSKWIPQGLWFAGILYLLGAVTVASYDAEPGFFGAVPYVLALAGIAIVFTLLMNAVERYNISVSNSARQSHVTPSQKGFA